MKHVRPNQIEKVRLNSICALIIDLCFFYGGDEGGCYTAQAATPYYSKAFAGVAIPQLLLLVPLRTPLQG